MPALLIVDLDGNERRVEVRAGTTVMLAAVGHDVTGVDGECGGCLSCATCHVYVDEDWLAKLPPVSHDEEQMLDFTAAERRTSSRLACQIELGPALDGLRVTVPDRQV